MTTTLPNLLPADEIANLDDEKFLDYVNDRLEHTSAFAVLNRPPLGGRTYWALGVLLNDLSQTAAENKRGMDEAAYAQWRRDVAEPLGALLRMRRSKAQGAMRSARDQMQSRHRRAYRATIGRLAQAIQDHRLAMVASGVDPEPHDRVLWGLLASERVWFDGVEMSLDEALATGEFAARDGEAGR